MKKSIRFSLFLLFSSMMVGSIVCGILLNVFMLEKFYIYKNKDSLRLISEEVAAVLRENEDIQTSIEEIDRAEGVSITVADKNFIHLYTSFSQNKGNNRLPKEIEELIKNTAGNLKKAPIYNIVEKNESQPKLVYVVMTEKEQYISLTKPMKGIRESTSIANQFYIAAGIAVLALGSILMFRFSDKVTRPIVEMSEAAEEISNLNFGKKLEIRSGNELGTLAGSINTLSDKLEQSIKGLKNDIEFQRTLTRNMSHELKTPIGVIKGYAEGLLFGVADNSEKREKYLQTITSECDRMDGLVKEILMLSKLCAKDYVLHDVTEFAASALAKDVAERFSDAAEKQGIRFAAECGEETGIFANYELALRAVSNLVSNAIKYCDGNKYVRLSCRETETDVCICVYNTSGGIPEDEMTKIFDDFYTIDPARSRESGSHGLGLSIVRSIANLHGGTISAENQEGGVEFVLSLPKKPG